MPVVDHYSERYHVPQQVIRAVVWVESYDDPDALSYLGARGYMQIMPGTAEYIANSTGMNAQRILFDPETNIRAGTWYFALWYHRFKRTDFALAAYYGGPKHVIDCQCVPSFTEHYVSKVMGLLERRDRICADGQNLCIRERE
jgi:soluble lytic murein transglycosylase